MNLIKRTIKFLTISVVLLHFIGVTQLVVSYSKNTTSLISMMNMTEEENKKEKDGKEENTDNKDFKNLHLFSFSAVSHSCSSITYIRLAEDVKSQHITSQITPPPNHLG